MEISQLKTGSKFQLTENFTVNQGTRAEKTFPVGLVFTLVNITINSQGKYVFLKVIRCKPVAKKYYEGIAEDMYKGATYGRKDSRRYVKARLRGIDAQRFLEMIGTARLINFNREYETLTIYGQ